MNTIKKLWLKLLSALAGIGSTAGEIILDALRIGAKKALADAIQIILPIALEANNSTLSGSIKRTMVLDAARKRATNLGLSFADNVLNTALELAVMKIKGEE